MSVPYFAPTIPPLALSFFILVILLIRVAPVTAVVDSGGRGDDNAGGGGGNLDPHRMESPELQLLLPLARQALLQHNEAERYDVGSTTTAYEDEEEFYSPKGSLGGRDSSSAPGSGFRIVFAANAGEYISRLNRDSGSTSFSSPKSHNQNRRRPLYVGKGTRSGRQTPSLLFSLSFFFFFYTLPHCHFTVKFLKL